MDVRIVSIDGKVSKYISEHLAKNPSFLKRNGYVLAEPSFMVTDDPKAEYIPEIKEKNPLEIVAEKFTLTKNPNGKKIQKKETNFKKINGKRTFRISRN